MVDCFGQTGRKTHFLNIKHFGSRLITGVRVPGTAAGHDGGIRLVHRPRPGSAVHQHGPRAGAQPQPRRRDAHVHHRAAQGRGEGRRAERRYPEDPGHAAGAGLAFRRAGDHKVCKGAPAPGRIRRMYL